MGTSSADPHQLDEYATEGVELVSALRTKVNDVTDALEALNASSSEHLPQYPGLDELLTDLLDDWQHLDEFVGDVAHGFYEADDGRHESGEVIQVADSTLLAEGRVGYADRDVAIAEAEEMAEELDRLREQEGGVSAEEMDDFVAMAERGQYDSAFAVTFSEQVGAEGYADATAMFEYAYNDRDGREVGQAIPQVAVLSTLLTTALDTVPRGEDGEYRDPSNADLSPEARIDSDFVYDLTTGYQPDDTREPGEHPWGHTGPDDLALVIGISDPPTEVAIQIAEDRMEPLLRPGAEATVGSNWPESAQDPVVNYATMLARNPDASAGWLVGEGNIELALDTANGGDGTVHEMADGGAAMADVVEAGLTNHDMHAPPPSGAPDNAEGPLIREELMDRAITFIGEDDEFSIRNDHMYDALASGVEHNMSVIDERINSGWSVDDQSYTHDDDNESMTQTQAFLTELLGDDDARDRVRDATSSYVQDQLDGDLPADDEGPGADLRDHRLNELGRVFGVVSDAEIDLITGEFEQAESEAALTGRVADYIVSWTPLGAYNDALALAENNVGAWIDAGLSPDSEEFQENLRNLLIDSRDQIEGLDLESDDLAQMRRGADDAADISE